MNSRHHSFNCFYCGKELESKTNGFFCSLKCEDIVTATESNDDLDFLGCDEFESDEEQISIDGKEYESYLEYKKDENESY